jgi:lysozyme family protein
MKESFWPALGVVMLNEGGFVDDPRDPGGATNMGITGRTLSTWLHRLVTVDDVRNMTRETAADIYRALYWDGVSGDDLPLGVDLMTFDGAVNLGVAEASRTLQGAVGAVPDGDIGPMTIKAASEAPAAGTVDKIRLARLRYYQALPGWGVYGKGWSARDTRTAATATAWITKGAAA